MEGSILAGGRRYWKVLWIVLETRSCGTTAMGGVREFLSLPGGFSGGQLSLVSSSMIYVMAQDMTTIWHVFPPSLLAVQLSLSWSRCHAIESPNYVFLFFISNQCQVFHYSDKTLINTAAMGPSNIPMRPTPHISVSTGLVVKQGKRSSRRLQKHP